MRHPACPRSPTECRITINSRSTNLLTGLAVYDGLGRLVASLPDTATLMTHYACRVCQAAWAVKARLNEPDEIVTHNPPSELP